MKITPNHNTAIGTLQTTQQNPAFKRTTGDVSGELLKFTKKHLNDGALKFVKNGFEENIAPILKDVDDGNTNAIVGMMGASACGKSFAMEHLSIGSNNAITGVEGDNYYADLYVKIKRAGGIINLIKQEGLTKPENFQLDLLREQINLLKQGVALKTPKYYMDKILSGLSVPNKIPVEPSKINVLGGVVTAFAPDAFDTKWLWDVSEITRKDRFYGRTGRGSSEVQDFLWKQTEQAHEKRMGLLKGQIDLVWNGEVGPEKIQEIGKDLAEIVRAPKKSFFMGMLSRPEAIAKKESNRFRSESFATVTTEQPLAKKAEPTPEYGENSFKTGGYSYPQ